MTAATPRPLPPLLADLTAAGADLDLEGDRLDLLGEPPEELVAELSAARPAVVDHLRAAETELRETVDMLAAEREWLAARDWLLPGDGSAAEFRANLARVRSDRGLLAALDVAREHYRAAVECRVLPLRERDR